MDPKTQLPKGSLDSVMHAVLGTVLVGFVGVAAAWPQMVAALA